MALIGDFVAWIGDFVAWIWDFEAFSARSGVAKKTAWCEGLGDCKIPGEAFLRRKFSLMSISRCQQERKNEWFDIDQEPQK